ncbi:hypothetical protein [Kitasatospora sp. NPDC059327]|uniref:hypothetical protein n=1 Tax=Kitasatospora sp. NPDC059327 TaxID=3346803 RepID=UPI0036C4D8D5
MHHEALRDWTRQDEADRGERDDRLTTTEKEELADLRKENAELRRAYEILKAASAISPRSSTRPGDLHEEVVEQADRHQSLLDGGVGQARPRVDRDCIRPSMVRP